VTIRTAETETAAVFSDAGSAREYVLLCCATLLIFATHSQSSYLSVVLSLRGLTPPQTGFVLGAYGIPVILATLFSGLLSAKFGVLRCMRLGAVLLTLGYMGFEFTSGSVMLNAACRFVQGAGFGFFLAPSMAYARSRLGPRRVVHLFGIFASMVPLPQAIGPLLAERYLQAYGLKYMFVFGSVPALLGLPLLFFLRELPNPAANIKLGKVFSLFAVAGLRLPLLSIAVVGLMFGYVTSFLSLLLTTSGIDVSSFFIPFGVTMVLGRFTLLPAVEAASKQKVTACSLFLLAASFAVLSAAPSSSVALIGGVLFGLGYSIAYPVLSIWASEDTEPSRRAEPLAAFNTVFNAGIMTIPYVVGSLASSGGNRYLMAGLAVLALALCVYLGIVRRRRELLEDASIRP
jgi:MFS family permease